jgi:hypothetical protein
MAGLITIYLPVLIYPTIDIRSCRLLDQSFMRNPKKPG